MQSNLAHKLFPLCGALGYCADKHGMTWTRLNMHMCGFPGSPYGCAHSAAAAVAAAAKDGSRTGCCGAGGAGRAGVPGFGHAASARGQRPGQRGPRRLPGRRASATAGHVWHARAGAHAVYCRCRCNLTFAFFGSAGGRGGVAAQHNWHACADACTGGACRSRL